jgi:hypothetical protein
MPRNAPNAGRNMNASRSPGSLRAMLRLAREGRRANNALATRASYSGWHFAGVAKSAAHYQYNAVAPALSTDTSGSRDALRAAQKPSRYFILVPPRLVQIRRARWRLLRKTFSKVVPNPSVCGK